MDLTRFLTYCKRVRIIDDCPPNFDEYSPTYREIQHVADHKPPGVFLPNLRSIEWPAQFFLNLPLSFFFSPNITKFNSQFSTDDHLNQIREAFDYHKPVFQHLELFPKTTRRNDILVKQLDIRQPNFQGLTTLIFSLGLSMFTIHCDGESVPLNYETITLLPRLPRLRKLHINLGYDGSHLGTLSPNDFIGFPSLHDIAIGWESSQSVPVILALLNGITSPSLAKIAFIPPYEVSPETMLKLTEAIAVYTSIGDIVIIWNKVVPTSQGIDNLPEWDGSLFVPPLYRLLNLRSLVIQGFIFQWNEDLCRSMASAWPTLTTFIVNQGPFGASLNIQYLAHFAKKCPLLMELSVPLESTYRNADTFAAVYKGIVRNTPLIIHDHGIYSENDLATALYLYTLFGPFIFRSFIYSSDVKLNEALRIVLKYKLRGGRIAKGFLKFNKWNNKNQ